MVELGRAKSSQSFGSSEFPLQSMQLQIPVSALDYVQPAGTSGAAPPPAGLCSPVCLDASTELSGTSTNAQEQTALCRVSFVLARFQAPLWELA
jgi:hypothetical protein